MPSNQMHPEERRSVGSLASIMSLRLLGLFMILPVLSLYTHSLAGATPWLIGVALGVYGLTQALFQIPFGMLSDHWGRKPMITAGLLIFIAGSLLSAYATTIHLMIVGRALQGAGAIGSTVTAMMADLTRVEQRSKAMAINGMTIGASFAVAMMLGPLLANTIALSGIFHLSAFLGVLALIILFAVVPTPKHTEWHADTEPDARFGWALLRDPGLLRLYASIFFLHAIFAASFVVIPISLQQNNALSQQQQAYLYLPTFFLAFVFSLFLLMRAEKRKALKQYSIGAIIALACTELCFMLGTHSFYANAIGLLGLFTAFSLLEASLPSWLSRAAPKARKGTALGIFSCAQYLGFFVGGLLGGSGLGQFGASGLYAICAVLALYWVSIAFGLKNPQYASTHRPHPGDACVNNQI